MTTRTFQTDITTEIFSGDGDRSISISQLGLILKRDILTIPIETIITPLDITDVNTGNSITMDKLTYLPIGLGALTVPTDGFTCNFNNSIQVQDYNATLAPPLVHSEAKLGANPLTLYGLQFTSTETIATTISNDNGNSMNITADGTLTCLGNNLNLNASDNVSINATNDAITITADDNITLTSVGLADINLDAPNINSYNYAMPICFTRQRTDNFSYTLGLQQFENVYTTNFKVPFEFVSDTPQIGYTSTNWKIDFALNTWNNTVVNDKGLACYFVLQDTALNFYTPITYNSTTPYVVWIQPSLYNDGTNNSFQNFNWSDYVDFSGLVGGGSGILPFDLILVFAADSAFNCNFSINVSLTRTNLV